MAFVVMLASAAVAAYGAVQSSKAQAASYKTSAEASRYNAAVNMQNATAAETAASVNELAMRRQNDQRMGAMRAQAAEGGGGFTGTNLEVLNQSATNMELDALNTRYRGQMQARGMLAAANLDEYQARGADMNAKSSITGGYLGAAASALGSVSNYYNYRSLAYGSGSTSSGSGSGYTGGW
jgi:hypothetical protein